METLLFDMRSGSHLLYRWCAFAWLEHSATRKWISYTWMLCIHTFFVRIHCLLLHRLTCSPLPFSIVSFFIAYCLSNLPLFPLLSLSLFFVSSSPPYLNHFSYCLFVLSSFSPSFLLCVSSFFIPFISLSFIPFYASPISCFSSLFFFSICLLSFVIFFYSPHLFLLHTPFPFCFPL